MFRPFELLKLIRDGMITRRTGLGMIEDSRTNDQLNRFFRGLEKLELIEKTEDRGIRPTKKLTTLLSALDISLKQLTDLTSQSVVCLPSFGHPSKPTTKADIFVVMPFSADLQPIYSDHIKEVAKQLKMSIARADDFFTADPIISDIWNAINAAKILIADCTGRNPNVFYEIGIAHTLGKLVILAAQSTNDIPFDVKHIRTILYEFTPRGMQEFEKTLRTTIEYELDRRPRTTEENLKRVEALLKDHQATLDSDEERSDDG